MIRDISPYAPAGSARALLPHGLAVRLSVTEQCQLRCSYCLPERNGKEFTCPSRENQPGELSTHELLTLIRLLHETHGIRRLRFTGGEPLLKRKLPELVAAINALGIDDLALTTNGQLLTPQAVALRAAGLKRLNVSLDTLCPETYRRLTRGGEVKATLEGIAAASSAGFESIKLNTVVLGGVNDAGVVALLDFALSHGHTLRFLELMPVGEGAHYFSQQFVSTSDTMQRLWTAGFQLDPLDWDIRETSRNFRVTATDGRTGTCGFISPTSQPFCQGCGRVRLTAAGHMHGCLANAGFEDLRPLLSLSDADAQHRAMCTAVSNAFQRKQTPFRFQHTVSSMATLGG